MPFRPRRDKRAPAAGAGRGTRPPDGRPARPGPRAAPGSSAKRPAKPGGGPAQRPQGGARRDRSGRPRDLSAAPSAPPADAGLERLQKVLAAAGIGSRRACEELITSGRVEVDRVVVTTLGTRVDAGRQEIRVDGERLPDPSRVVYMLYKPVGVVSTHYDPSGRPRVVDLVPGERRLFPIGRLDRMSEGLILVTNDGGLANRLAHPRYGVEKRYQVQVAGRPTPETLDRLRQGVPLAEGLARVQRVSIRSQNRDSSVLDMVLDEGKNREIRRILAKMGHKVHQLKRVAIGSLSLGNLLPGEHRRLGWEEVERLRQETVAEAPPASRRRADSGKGRRQHRASPPSAAAGGRSPGGRTERRTRRRPGRASQWRAGGTGQKPRDPQSGGPAP